MKDNYITVYSSIQADFSATPTSGVAPLEVDFTNLSLGDFTASLWEFGDGITSTLESPTHTYPTAGAYTVTLTVSGLGGLDTEVKDSYITAYTQVEANFIGYPTDGTAPLTVVFTNTSSGDFSSSLWDFGDGSTSTLDNPTHIYEIVGVYTVTLGISGLGGTDEEVKIGYISVQPGAFNTYLPLVIRNAPGSIGITDDQSQWQMVHVLWRRLFGF